MLKKELEEKITRLSRRVSHLENAMKGIGKEVKDAMQEIYRKEWEMTQPKPWYKRLFK